VKVQAILCENGSVGYLSRGPQLSTVEPPPTIFIEVTPSFHERDPDYCFMSEKRNTARKNPQQKLVFRIYIWWWGGAVLTHGDLCAARYAGDLCTPLCKITVSFPLLYNCEICSVIQGDTHSLIKMIMSKGEVIWGLLGLKTAEITCG
jgi:hypothetical protein